MRHASRGFAFEGPRRDAEIVQIDALAVQHAKQIMIRRQQQLGRVTERRIAGEPLRVGMTVRAQDRQVTHFRIQAAGDLPNGGFSGEQTIFVQV